MPKKFNTEIEIPRAVQPGQATTLEQVGEMISGKFPYIGDNGNWYTWDGTEFVDTGVRSQGKDGEPGKIISTPIENLPTPNSPTNGSGGLPIGAIVRAVWNTSEFVENNTEYLWLDGRSLDGTVYADLIDFLSEPVLPDIPYDYSGFRNYILARTIPTVEIPRFTIDDEGHLLIEANINTFEIDGRGHLMLNSINPGFYLDEKTGHLKYKEE